MGLGRRLGLASEWGDHFRAAQWLWVGNQVGKYSTITPELLRPLVDGNIPAMHGGRELVGGRELRPTPEDR